MERSIMKTACFASLDRADEWRPVVGLKYEVSSAGEIRSLHARPPRTLRGHLNGKGYIWVTLSPGAVQKSLAALVCEAFHGPRPAGYQCCHLNGDRTDNRASNLKWATVRENISHKYDHGTILRGSDNCVAKLDEQRVAKIKAELLRGVPGAEIARREGVNKVTIYYIKYGRTWTHVQPLEAADG